MISPLREIYCENVTNRPERQETLLWETIAAHPQDLAGQGNELDERLELLSTTS